MTVAAVLIAYAACVGTLGGRLLGRARWTARAPLLAIVTYLAAGWSVVAALGLGDARRTVEKAQSELQREALPAGQEAVSLQGDGKPSREK